MSSKCAECEEGLPEWIMSYADMITILMAFFVVMYSMAGSGDDSEKQEAVLKSLREQFRPHWLGSFGAGAFTPQRSSISPLSSAGAKADENERKKRIAQNRGRRGNHPRIHILRPGEQAAVGGVIFFSGRDTTLDAEQIEQIAIAALEVDGKPQKIEIRGHTSRRASAYQNKLQDNWDLSYARCRATMEEMVKLGVDPKRIRLSVAADNEPLIRAGDPLAYKQSSRVEVFMLSEVVDSGAESLSPPASTDSPP